jgi:hypothetical protein
MKSTRKRQDAKIKNLIFCTDKKEYINSRTINEAADLQRETEETEYPAQIPRI